MPGEARTAIVLTARGAEQQAQGVNNTLSFINIALGAGTGGQAEQRVRLPDRAGERTGRQGARAEGRPTAGLPQD